LQWKDGHLFFAARRKSGCCHESAVRIFLSLSISVLFQVFQKLAIATHGKGKLIFRM